MSKSIIVTANERQIVLATCTLSALLGGLTVGIISLVCAPFFGTAALTQGLVFSAISISILLAIMMSLDTKVVPDDITFSDEEEEDRRPVEVPVGLAEPVSADETLAAEAPEEDITAFVEHLRKAKEAEDAKEEDGGPPQPVPETATEAVSRTD